jgi:uncharacterized membrane protein HdeD (DUF308 family)
MPSIEDFCNDLFQGKKSVDVPKGQVTEVSSGWYKSKYDLPHHGSQGSLRKGRLHAHDMGDHYSVHLDRVDPKLHGMEHLIVDAPLVFFIWNAFANVFALIKDSLKEGAEQSADTKNYSESKFAGRLIVGIGLVILGSLVVFDPAIGIVPTTYLITFVLMLLGATTIIEARKSKKGGVQKTNLILGVLALVAGFVAMLFIWLALVLLILFLAYYTLSTASYFLRHPGDVSAEFAVKYIPMVIGVLSLILGVLLLIESRLALDIIYTILGVLIIAFGGSRIISAIYLRRARENGEKT